MADQEVMREVDVVEPLPIARACVGCGEILEFWINGGRGHWEYCCGYEYALKPVRFDYVVTRESRVPYDRER